MAEQLILHFAILVFTISPSEPTLCSGVLNLLGSKDEHAFSTCFVIALIKQKGKHVPSFEFNFTHLGQVFATHLPLMPLQIHFSVQTFHQRYSCLIICNNADLLV